MSVVFGFGPLEGQRMPIRIFVALLVAWTSCAPAQERVVIRAGMVLDGRGGVERNAEVTVQGSRIVRATPASQTAATYDFPRLTLMPGMIDTHVHFNFHFGADGRYVIGAEPPARMALHGAENAYVTLMAGFTAVQSIGAASDIELRAAIERGVLPGPRLLTSVVQ